jgi:hypothetical protein
MGFSRFLFPGAGPPDLAIRREQGQVEQGQAKSVPKRTIEEGLVWAYNGDEVAMKVTTVQEYKPAKGLTQLTWPQVEEIDAKLRSLCVYAEQTGQEVMLTIFINRNGKPVSIGQPLLVERFSPAR